MFFQEKLHITAHAARLNVGWQTAAKQTLLQFYEEARTVKAGYSVEKYIEVFTRDYLAKLSLEERRHLLASGEKWPASALSTLASLPENPGPAVLATVRELDAKVAPQCANSDTFRRLRVGIIAVLGAADEPASQEHLRKIYRDEPEYRDPVAMSLTQHPGGENWKLLVDALRTAEGAAAQEILIALAKVDQRPADAAPYRYAILAGLKLGDNGANDAIALLNHWTNSRDQAWSRGHTGRLPAANGSPNWQPQLASYQQQYAAEIPRRPARSPPRRRRPRQVELRRAPHVPQQRRGPPGQRRPRRRSLRQGPVRLLPPRRHARRNHRPRPHRRRPPFSTQRDSRIDRLPLARY